MRQGFLSADAGITGGNFLVAETGTVALVTNEGNGDLTNTLPDIHIVTAGIEKVIPTLEDLSTMLRLLARSATGQEMSVYTTMMTGPKRPDDLDGPSEHHVVLIDNGRSSWLGNEFHEMLRCIRCGACINHCPVWNTIGGHAYGWVYPGPMGSVLTPLMTSLDEAGHLPNACTMNGHCQTVCPMSIPLPSLLRRLRFRQFDHGLVKWSVNALLGVWGYVAKRPRLYHTLSGLGVRALSLVSFGRGRFKWLPFMKGWTQARDFPAPQKTTFMAQYRAGKGRR